MKNKTLNPGIFVERLKNKVEMRLRMTKKPSDFSFWLMEYFEEICESLYSQIKKQENNESKMIYICYK